MKLGHKFKVVPTSTFSFCNLLPHRKGAYNVEFLQTGLATCAHPCRGPQMSFKHFSSYTEEQRCNAIDWSRNVVIVLALNPAGSSLNNFPQPWQPLVSLFFLTSIYLFHEHLTLLKVCNFCPTFPACLEQVLTSVYYMIIVNVATLPELAMLPWEFPHLTYFL